MHIVASSVASSIIRPLEIYTRGGVITTVNEMLMREKERLARANKSVTLGTSQPSEFDIDDVAENEFHNIPARGGGSSFDESDDQSNVDEEDESIGDDSDDSSEIEVRLGNVDDTSEDSSDEEEEEGDFSEESEDEEEDDEEDDESDEDESMDEEPHYSDESDGDEIIDEDTEEDFFFDANADDEGNNSVQQRAAVGNQVLDESMMEGWTRADNGGRTGLGRMLLNMVQPNNLGRQHHLANGGFLMDAAETVLGNILRGDLGLEGISAEIEDSLGIVVRGDRGDGRLAALGLSTGLANRTNLSGSIGLAGTNIGGVGRPAVHQTSNSTSSPLFGNRGQVVEAMEVVFGGGNSAVITAPDEVDHVRYPSIPVSYDTNLFPGGVAAASCIQSTQLSTGSGPSVHPLIQSLFLPPATSINSITPSIERREGSNFALQRINGISGSYAGASGSIIQVNDRLQPINAADQVSRRANPTTFSIWTDDGIDDFSVSFGRALDSFLQEAHNAETSSNGEASENAEDASTSNHPSAAEELQSETAVGVLNNAIDQLQQASDSPPDSSMSNDHDGVQLNHPADNVDVMDEDHSAAAITAVDEAVADAGGQIILAAEADPHEPNQDEEALVEDGSDERPAENISNDDGLRCPPDIDLEVWASLPLE